MTEVETTRGRYGRVEKKCSLGRVEIEYKDENVGHNNIFLGEKKWIMR